MSRPRITDIPADRLEGEAVAAFFFEDERPVRSPAALIDWRLNGVLTELLLAGEARGTPGERILVLGNGKLATDWALFAGGGSWRGLDRGNYAHLIRDLLEACQLVGFSRFALCLSPLDGMDTREMERLVAEVLEDEREVECLISVTPRPPSRFLPRSA